MGKTDDDADLSWPIQADAGYTHIFSPHCSPTILTLLYST